MAKVKTPHRRIGRFMPIGFPGYRVTALTPTLEQFGHEIDEFTTALPGVREFIGAWGPWAAKLRREDAAPATRAFSSAAYPECPDVIFYTELIRFHLPPQGVWGPGRAWPNYPLLENLVHESIHHWWHDMHWNFSMLAEVLDDEMSVSWRPEKWSVEKALHAGMVYMAASELRWMFAPEEADAARAAAAEIFAEVPEGEWTEWALDAVHHPGKARFLRELELI